MAKKVQLQEFLVKQSDLDKALAYHLNKNTKEHDELARLINADELYSYCVETIRMHVKPYDGFRKILEPIVQSLFSDNPKIVITSVNPIDNFTSRRILNGCK